MNVLETEQLNVRPFSMTDLDESHQLLDIDIQWAGPSFTREQRRQRLQRYIVLAEWDEGSHLFGYRAIIHREEGQMIGICGFLPGLWTPQTNALF